MTVTKPPRVAPGDEIRIVAPASHFDRASFDRGVEIVKSLGWRPTWRDDLFATHRYLAGDDARRAAELAEAFADPKVKAIWCARGGYGTPRILDMLDWVRIVRSPKALIGFSDVTALLLALASHGMVGFHGPMISGRMAEKGLGAREKETLVACLGSTRPLGAWGEGRTVVAGVAEGKLVGGTLSMICAVLGTPFAAPSLFEGAILFLEDVGEKPFRLDRMMTQLALAGILERVAGVALGRFDGCVNPADPSVDGAKLVEELAAAAGKPTLAGLPFGHGGENRTLPVGVRARIADGTLSILEGAVG